MGGHPGGGLSPAPSPLPNALNSFFSNMQNQVPEPLCRDHPLSACSAHDALSHRIAVYYLPHLLTTHVVGQ
jgi:hypothetical protein